MSKTLTKTGTNQIMLRGDASATPIAIQVSKGILGLENSDNAFGGTTGRGWRVGVDDQPWRNNGNSFSIACGDIDNDGDIDLYTGEIAHGEADHAGRLAPRAAGRRG